MIDDMEKTGTQGGVKGTASVMGMDEVLELKFFGAGAIEDRPRPVPQGRSGSPLIRAKHSIANLLPECLLSYLF